MFTVQNDHVNTALITYISATIRWLYHAPWLCAPASRELGRQRSSIELDTASVAPAQLQALEEAVNDKIRAHVPVTLQLLSLDDPALEKVRTEKCFSTTRKSSSDKYWVIKRVLLSKVSYS